MSTNPSVKLKVQLAQDSQSVVADELITSKPAAKTGDALSQAANERYRCPEKFFNLGINGQLSNNEGYFRFGPDTICYGRSSAGTPASRANARLRDAFAGVQGDDTKLRLPFDLTEILDNLRLERYANGFVKESLLKKLARKLYYRLRPLTNLAIRKQVQQLYARNWRERPFPGWPVDTTVENVFESVLLSSMKAKGAQEIPFVWFWPNGARGCLTMTHDVETEAGRDFCGTLMNVDDSFGIKAAFGIVPEERYEVPPRLIKSIRSRGFEVAVQDLNHDGRLFDNQEEFLRRAKIINRYGREFGARGFRAAILYRKPEWYNALEFEFDMSFPNVAPLDPQRGGCCTVMPFFIGDVLELPVTTTQDYTLFHVLNERSIDLWKLQTEMILSKNGLVSFIVHPDYILDPDKLSAYENLLGYLRELREKSAVWCALPSEINTWWRARSKMSLVKDGDSWRIEGDGKERAVVAYARNVEGKLVYQFAQRPEAGMPGQG